MGRPSASSGGSRAARRNASPGPGGPPVTAIYDIHYGALVRQAARLVRDHATAEDVVQDVFTTLHGRDHRLRDSDNALAYVRRSVTNRAVSLLRHRIVVEQQAQASAPATAPSAEDNALALLERSLLITALNKLAPRQRQVLLLRYYAGLTEAQTAAVLGISTGTVKAHGARARASLRAALRAVILTTSRTTPASYSGIR